MKGRYKMVDVIEKLNNNIARMWTMRVDDNGAIRDYYFPTRRGIKAMQSRFEMRGMAVSIIPPVA